MNSPRSLRQYRDQPYAELHAKNMEESIINTVRQRGIHAAESEPIMVNSPKKIPGIPTTRRAGSKPKPESTTPPVGNDEIAAANKASDAIYAAGTSFGRGRYGDPALIREAMEATEAYVSTLGDPATAAEAAARAHYARLKENIEADKYLMEDTVLRTRRFEAATTANLIRLTRDNGARMTEEMVHESLTLNRNPPTDIDPDIEENAPGEVESLLRTGVGGRYQSGGGDKRLFTSPGGYRFAVTNGAEPESIFITNKPYAQPGYDRTYQGTTDELGDLLERAAGEAALADACPIITGTKHLKPKHHNAYVNSDGQGVVELAYKTDEDQKVELRYNGTTNKLEVRHNGDLLNAETINNHPLVTDLANEGEEESLLETNLDQLIRRMDETFRRAAARSGAPRWAQTRK